MRDRLGWMLTKRKKEKKRRGIGGGGEKSALQQGRHFSLAYERGEQHPISSSRLTQPCSCRSIPNVLWNMQKSPFVLWLSLDIRTRVCVCVCVCVCVHVLKVCVCVCALWEEQQHTKVGERRGEAFKCFFIILAAEKF